MKDFVLDSDYDLMFRNNDLLIQDTTRQEIELICLTVEGQLRQFPTFGANIQTLINGNWNLEIQNSITKSLNEDGFKINEITYDENGLYIDATK